MDRQGKQLMPVFIPSARVVKSILLLFIGISILSILATTPRRLSAEPASQSFSRGDTALMLSPEKATSQNVRGIGDVTFHDVHDNSYPLMTSASVGGRIAFVSDRQTLNGDTDIWAIDEDGSNPRRITGGRDNDSSPAWSRDGRKLVFQSSPQSSISDKFVLSDLSVLIRLPRPDLLAGSMMTVNADGTGVFDLRSFGINPHWSPDGRWITYHINEYRGADNSRITSQLRAINPDGNGDHVLWETGSSDFITGHSWAPDGSRLVVGLQDNSDSGANLASLNPDGSGFRIFHSGQSSGPGEGSGDPDFSPSGDYIAFTGVTSPNPLIPAFGCCEVSVVSSRGGGQASTVRGDWTFQPRNPSWGNGPRLAYQESTDRSRSGGASDSDIYFIDSSGTNIDFLSWSGSNETDPAWSWASSGAAKIAIRLVGVAEGATIVEGRTVDFCYSLQPPQRSNIRVMNIYPGGTNILVEGSDDGRGDCSSLIDIVGAGKRTLVAELWSGDWSQLVDRAETYFYVAGLPTPTRTATTAATRTATSSATPPPPPPPPPCTNDAQTLSVSGGGSVNAGSIVEASFELRNSGGCAWRASQGYDFANINGQSFGAASPQALPRDVGPGEVVRFQLRMVAPGAAGDAVSNWRMRRSGTLFGASAELRLTVVSPPPPIEPPPVTPRRSSYIVFVHGWQGLKKEGYSSTKGYTSIEEDKKDSSNEFGPLTKSLYDAGYSVYFVHWDSNKDYTESIYSAADHVLAQLQAIKEKHPQVRSQRRVIIAHSMGGLVARRALVKLDAQGVDDDVLITFGTPHLGVRSDSLMRLLTFRFPEQLGAVIDCANSPGTCDLGIENVKNKFNPDNPVTKSVSYNFIGGVGLWAGSPFCCYPPISACDGIIRADSAVGDSASLIGGTAAHRYLVRDTHMDWPIPSLFSAYSSGGDSRKCLAAILGVDDIAKDSGAVAACFDWTTHQAAELTQPDNAGLFGTKLTDQAWVSGAAASGRITGRTETISMPVDGTALAVWLSWTGSGLEPRFVDPSDRSKTSLSLPDLKVRYPDAVIESSTVGDVSMVTISLPSAAGGRWEAKLTNNSGKEAVYSLQTFMQSDLRLDISSPEIVRVGDRIRLEARVLDGDNSLLKSAEVVATWQLGGREFSRSMMWSPARGAFVLEVQAEAGVPGMVFKVEASDEERFGRIETVMVAIADPVEFPQLPVSRRGRVLLPLLLNAGRLNCPVTEREPNDTRADADQLPSLCAAVPVRGRVVPGDARDAFAFDIDRSMAIEAVLRPDVGAADLDLYLFRERDETFVAKSERLGDAVEVLKVDLQPGRYYVLAYPAGGRSIDAGYEISWRMAP